MKIIIGFLIFCIILFIYLHIQFHIKKSNDLEIYEIEEVSKDKFEEICDLRQPVVFDFDNQKIIDTTNKTFVKDKYDAFEIKIRNTKDTDLNGDLYISLPLHASEKLFEEDKVGSYYSENNSDFLKETGCINNFKYNDQYLRPSMVSNMNYDIMLGSENTCTPFRYEINYRNFFLCSQGKCTIQLAPPQSVKYLFPYYDYENYEYRSLIDPWNVDKKYNADFEKVKCLTVILEKGKTIFIPAYWWYSIKFTKDSSLSCLKYRTYMNNLAISPYIGMHILQMGNIRKKISKSKMENKPDEELNVL
jgi:hypothetical protein